MITYNHAPFINDAIEGIMMQKVDFDIELIIGEDGSTDNTRSICEDFVGKYPGKINLLSYNGNMGMMKNFSRVLSNCSGKYIALCEGDDYWIDECKLQMQVEELEKNKNATISFTNIKVLNEAKNIFSPNWAIINNDSYKFQDILSFNCISTCTVVYKNIFINSLPKNFDSYPIGDLPLYLFLLLHGDAIYLNKVTSIYRQHSGGAYSSISSEKRFGIMAKMYYLLLEEPSFYKHRSKIKTLISKINYSRLSFEIIKSERNASKLFDYFKKTIRYINVRNLWYPLKSMIKLCFMLIKH